MTIYRISDGYKKHLQDFANNVLVVCPTCGKQATVLNPKESKVAYQNIKIICTSCGYNKKLENKPHSSPTQKPNPIIVRIFIYGASVDPFFQLPLWLKTNVENNELWAYNYEHLSYLESIVESRLRERDIDDNQNRSIGSRLPRWMTSSKNRDNILRAIRILKSRK